MKAIIEGIRDFWVNAVVTEDIVKEVIKNTFESTPNA